MKVSTLSSFLWTAALSGLLAGCELEYGLFGSSGDEGGVERVDADEAEPGDGEGDAAACEPGRGICEDAFQGCLADGWDEALCEEDFQLCVADSEWPDDGHAPCGEGEAQEGACEPGRDICEDAFQGCLADGVDEALCEEDFQLCVADSEWPDDGHAPCEPGRWICEEAYQDCLAEGHEPEFCEVDFDLCVADSEWPDDDHEAL